MGKHQRAAAAFETDVSSSEPQPAITPSSEAAVSKESDAHTPETPHHDGPTPLRTWVSDAQQGYTRLSDDGRRRIVLLFDAKPGDDVLTAVKAGGFRYHPDYHGHKNAWVRRNDFEGRFQLEAIEKLIRGPVQEQEANTPDF